MESENDWQLVGKVFERQRDWYIILGCYLGLTIRYINWKSSYSKGIEFLKKGTRATTGASKKKKVVRLTTSAMGDRETKSGQEKK